MRKKIFFLLFTISLQAVSQVGINTETPSTAAVFYLEAQNFPSMEFGGLLIPVVTESEQASIPISTVDSSDEGLLVFVNDPLSGKRCLDIYDGMAHLWRSIYCFSTPDTCPAIPIVLFEEDFEGYATNSGVTGTSSSNGDYPSSVTKWTLTSFTGFGSSTPSLPGTLIDSDDYALVQSGELVFRDTNGTFRFETQPIDITGYTDILISMDIREEGPLDYAGESTGSGPADHTNDFACGETISDYLDIEYSTDGGINYTEISNYNGYGNTDHTFNNELPGGVINFSTSGLSGTSLVIRVRLQNWAGDEYYFLDNIIVTCN